MATRCLAVRLGGAGINVYEIRPGVIATDMTSPVLDRYTKKIAQGFTVTPRMGDIHDVGSAAAVLTAGRLAYCTGQILEVDGGLLVPRY